MEPLNLVFAGTPAFAAAHLQALLASRHRLVAVYTQPDRPAGRGKHLVASPVKQLAEANQLPLVQAQSLRSEAEQKKLAAFAADLMVVVAYGLLLPPSILATPRFGCINVHASLLPRWRGAAPIERALLAGDRESGITIMQMDAGLDTGDMLYQARLPITADMDRIALENALTALGCQALLHSLDHFHTLREQARPQDDSLSTYAAKLKKEEALIDWSQPAAQIERQVRAGIGRNPAYTFFQGERLRILQAQAHSQTLAHTFATADTGIPAGGTLLACSREGLQVACADSTLLIQQVQFPGKNPVRIQDLLNTNTNRFAVASRFQSDDTQP
ncbi:MAG: methionyl-tRNA formyltransferase [Pseudomonadales bacterium]|nr:methionyl-tRNA formyltransferase [Pseudomonadales bacterium]